MRCVVVYDVPDDRARGKIAEVCLDYGLDRIQYSAFAGRLSRNLMEELMLKMKERLGKRPGKLLLLPLPEDVWQDRLHYEKEGGRGEGGE